MELVREVADQIAVMQKGKIVENKSKSALFKKPEHPYTKALLACRPNIHKNLKRLATINDFLENDALDATRFYSQNEFQPEQIKKSREIYYTQAPIMEVQAL